VIIYFGLLFENYTRAPNLWATYFHGRVYVIVLEQKELGYILGDFVTN
jgi:hypothetical protein